MSHGNPTAPPAAHERTADTQTLVALLQGLMPLLLHIQQSPAFAGQLPFQLEPGSLAGPNPMLDHQAAVSLVEDITADPLCRLSTYLEAHAGQHPELQSCIGTVTQAAHCFAAREYAQAFGLIWQAYRMIAALRALNPQLPPLRAFGPAHSSASPPTTSIH
jgi:hypothetical protein